MFNVFCYGAFTDIKLPEGLSEIGQQAFEGCTGLISVTIPDTVNIIAKQAFSDCTSLKYITFPLGLKSLGTRAFFGCTALGSVFLPDGIEQIGTSVFENCSSLEQVHIPEIAGENYIGSKDQFFGTPYYRVKNHLCRNCGAKLFWYPFSKKCTKCGTDNS